MEKQVIKKRITYFAQKKCIQEAIKLFGKNPQVKEIDFDLETEESPLLEITIQRQTLIKYFGFAPWLNETRFKKECKIGGKFFHKYQVLEIYAMCLNKMYEDVKT